MKRESSREGYLMIDHRFSPGLPEDVARATGLDPRYCGEGKLLEAATLTCSHCKAVVVKNPLRTRERSKCFKCGWHYVCDLCAAEMAQPGYDHLSFEALVEVEQRVAQRGVVRFLGTPQELLTTVKANRTPELNPLAEKV
jgi:hypothetical protein